MVKKPTVVSLFAGCGGSSLGYTMAGFDERLAIEWDDHAARTFTENFPNIKLFHGDIASLSSESALEMSGIGVGDLDVLDGSPPCQGFSTAGKRLIDDPRNSLFKEYIRILNTFKPKALVMENVTGMVKGHMKGIYLEIVSELRGCGYCIAGKVMNSKWFSVPQSRERVIIIGIRSDLGKNPIHPKPISEPIPAKLACLGADASEFIPIPDGSYAMALWAAMRPGESGSKKDPKGGFFGFIKLHPSLPSPTIIKTVGMSASKTRGFSTALLHWSEARTMSIGELKRLHSIPDDFKIGGTFKEKWARIGNSVPPKLMEAIANSVRKTICST